MLKPIFIRHRYHTYEAVDKVEVEFSFEVNVKVKVEMLYLSAVLLYRTGDTFVCGGLLAIRLWQMLRDHVASIPFMSPSVYPHLVCLSVYHLFRHASNFSTKTSVPAHPVYHTRSVSLVAGPCKILRRYVQRPMTSVPGPPTP